MTKIAIIGAGPAGLTMARLLHLATPNIDLSIYERDASPTSRDDQGGTLDLHTHTGLAAIRKCGLWDSFSKHARYDGQELIIADKNATELVHLKSFEGKLDRPEIDRARLKDILLESVPEEWLRWGRQLREVTPEGMLKFDGKNEMDGPFDLVVGADGGWSKVRARLTETKPSYSGVSGFELEIKNPAKLCPRLNQMAGRGGLFGSSDRKLLNCQRIGNDNLKVRSWFLCPEGEAQQTLQKFGTKGTLEIIKEKYPDWAPEMTELLEYADPDSLRVWTTYELPVGHKWAHQKGFTLMGDAASLTTPFGGDGVNTAMKNALELAELIERSEDPHDTLTLDQAVIDYEQLLFPYARKIQAAVMNYKQIIFSSEAPIGLMTGMLKAKTSESSSILINALGSAPFVAALYGYTWVRLQIGLAIRTYWRRT